MKVFSLLTVSNSSGGLDMIFRNEIQKPEKNETQSKEQICTQQQCLPSHTPVLDLLLFNWDQTHNRSGKIH